MTHTVATDVYVRYFKARQQSGGSAAGEIPVYRGSHRSNLQSGAGLGDFLRGIFRFAAPLVLRGLASFAGNTMRAHEQGVPLGQAAKAAALPAIGEAMAQLGIAAAPNRGAGKKRRRQKGGNRQRKAAKLTCHAAVKQTGGKSKKTGKSKEKKASAGGAYKKKGRKRQAKQILQHQPAASFNF